jgi:hypothetical protein
MGGHSAKLRMQGAKTGHAKCTPTFSFVGMNMTPNMAVYDFIPTHRQATEFGARFSGIGHYPTEADERLSSSAWSVLILSSVFCP